MGRDFIFAYAYGGDSFLLDKNTGKVLSKFNYHYACTRFTLSEPYLIGCNVDMIDAANGFNLVSIVPALDVRECVGVTVSNGRFFLQPRRPACRCPLSGARRPLRLTTPGSD